MPYVLLTGFAPFADHIINPSQQIAERLHGEIIAGATVVGRTLPVAYGEDIRIAAALVEEFEPKVILSLGLNAGSSFIDVELYALNQRQEKGGPLLPILAGGPAAYPATIDVDEVGTAIGSRAGVPVRRHGGAGTYLCNHIFYQCLHFVKTRRLDCRVGFLHIPLSSDQARLEGKTDLPSLPLDDMTTAVRAALEAAVTPPQTA